MGPEADRHGRAPSRSELAYQQLRQLILAGEFAYGARITENAMASRLELSRTPVREALVRLHADRLLDRRVDGGYYVASPDLAQLEDLYELRVTLELRGITRAIIGPARHDENQLAAIRDAWEALRTVEPELDGSFIRHDEAYHTGLCAASGNRALAETLAQVNVQIRSVRSYDFLTEDRIERTITEHLAIVGALLDRRPERAVELMSDHIGASMAVVKQRVQRALIAMLEMRGRGELRPPSVPAPQRWTEGTW